MVQSKDKYAFYAVALYFSVVVFGNFFRMGSEETGYGISTLLVFTLILLKIRDIPPGLSSNSLYRTIAFLFAWCFVSAAFSATSVLVAYFKLGMLVLYLFVSVAVFRMSLTETRIKVLFYGLGASILFASALTVIDFLNIYNFPYVNENDVTTKIGGERIEQAGGFFQRRSSMAAYYSIIIPALLYYAFKIKNIKEKTFMLVAGVVSYIALFLTHNRSGVLGIVISLLAYMLIDRSLRLHRKLTVLISMMAVFVLFIFVVYLYLPTHFEVYVMKLASYLPGVGEEGAATEERYIQSDYSRIYFFESVMESLIDNPIGNGFSKIYTEQYGVGSPHNIITLIIWAAGIVAFVWIPVFALQVKKHFGLKQLVDQGKITHPLVIPLTALQVGILSWLLNNMAHNSLATGLAWMYLGLILNIMWMMKHTDDAPDSASATKSSDDFASMNNAGNGGKLSILRAANENKVLRKRENK